MDESETSQPPYTIHHQRGIALHAIPSRPRSYLGKGKGITKPETGEAKGSADPPTSNFVTQSKTTLLNLVILLFRDSFALLL